MLKMHTFFIPIIFRKSAALVQTDGIVPVVVCFNEKAVMAPLIGFLDKVLYQFTANAAPLVAGAD